MNTLHSSIAVAFVTTMVSLGAATAPGAKVDQKNALECTAQSAITITAASQGSQRVYDMQGMPIIVEWHKITNEQEFTELCPQLIPVLTAAIKNFANETKKYLVNAPQNYVADFAKLSPEQRAKYEASAAAPIARCEDDIQVTKAIEALCDQRNYAKALETLRSHCFECPGYQLSYLGKVSVIIVKSEEGKNLAFALFDVDPEASEQTEKLCKVVVAPEAQGRGLWRILGNVVHPINEPSLQEIQAEIAKLSGKLNTLNEQGYSPLHEFIINEENIKPYLIQAAKEATPGWTEKYGRTFGSAVSHPSGDPVTISWDADSLSKDELLEYYLAAAKKIQTLRAETVKLFIRAGAQVDLPDSYGRTALWWAAERNQPGEMIALIELGAHSDSCGDNNPLMVAVCDGNKEAVESLLSHGANPNIVDEEGDTLLHSAARGEMWIYPSHDPEYKKIRPEKLQNYKDTITLLMRYGASNTIKNKDGLTPSQVARQQQQEFYPELTEFPLADHIEKCAACIQ